MNAKSAGRYRLFFKLFLLLAPLLARSAALADEASLPTFRPTVMAIHELTRPGIIRFGWTPPPQVIIAEISDAKMTAGQPQEAILIGTSLYENDKDGAPTVPEPLFCVSNATIEDPKTCDTKATSVGKDTGSVYLAYRNIPASAGAYAGELRFSGPGNQRFALPFTLSVKHGIWLPLVIIVLGCGIAVILNFYTTQQRRLDELQVALDRLVLVAHEWKVNDPTFNEAVRAAQNAIELQTADDAQSKIEAARTRLIDIGRTANGAAARSLTRGAQTRSSLPVRTHCTRSPDGLLDLELRDRAVPACVYRPQRPLPRQPDLRRRPD